MLETDRKAPVLVTGAHRSGTTWVAETLCSGRELHFVDEPFNPGYRPRWMRHAVPYWFTYVSEPGPEPVQRDLDAVLSLRYPWGQALGLRSRHEVLRFLQLASSTAAARLTHKRLLVKDPLALFSAPWVQRRYGADVVVCVRHPAAFVSSLQRLGWTFDAGNLTQQEALMADLLGPWEEQVRAAAVRPGDIVDQGILLWRVIYGVARRYRDEHPGWLFVRHEDLSQEPVSGFRSAYEALGLRWDDAAVRAVTGRTNRENPSEVPVERFKTTHRDSRALSGLWRSRLSAVDVHRVRTALEEDADWVYGADDW